MQHLVGKAKDSPFMAENEWVCIFTKISLEEKVFAYKVNRE